MRIGKKIKPDYEAISRRSIAKDFYPERIHIRQDKSPENEKKPKITPRQDGERITSINPICEYAKYARFFVGKLVKLVSDPKPGGNTTGWYEFIFDEDRKALNAAAGWSDLKKRYYLEKPKFKKEGI